MRRTEAVLLLTKAERFINLLCMLVCVRLAASLAPIKKKRPGSEAGMLLLPLWSILVLDYLIRYTSGRLV